LLECVFRSCDQIRRKTKIKIAKTNPENRNAIFISGFVAVFLFVVFLLICQPNPLLGFPKREGNRKPRKDVDRRRIKTREKVEC